MNLPCCSRRRTLKCKRVCGRTTGRVMMLTQAGGVDLCRWKREKSGLNSCLDQPTRGETSRRSIACVDEACKRSVRGEAPACLVVRTPRWRVPLARSRLKGWSERLTRCTPVWGNIRCDPAYPPTLDHSEGHRRSSQVDDSVPKSSLGSDKRDTLGSCG